MEQDRSKLAEALRSGNLEVLDHLIGEHGGRLFRYLLSLTGNRATAEDLFQETWIRVMERGHQYRAQWNFGVWLFSIARHLAIDLVRRKKMQSLDEMMDPDEGAGFEPEGSTASPFDDVLAGEQHVRIARVMAKIPAAYRETLVLRFQEDLTLEEIAAVINAPISTVKSRLYRGVEALKRGFEGASA